MSEISVPEAGVGWRQWPFTQLVLRAVASAIAHSGSMLRSCLRTLRAGAGRVRSAGSRSVAAVASIRLPVSRSTHDHVLRQLERFEAQAVVAVRTVECRQKRTQALLALARSAYETGRDNRAFLTATVEELQTEHYWQRKQTRIFAAAQLACATAGLAARSGHAVIARDAYLCGQTYNGKVVGVDRKIGLATAFADVADLLDAGYDRVAWLTTAMELACGIAEQIERFGAVNFVARKMVVDRIPPCDDRRVDKRFAVDVSAMAKLAAPAVEKPAASGAESEFEIVM